VPGEKRLFLVRHAKSSWDDQALDDHDRPLAPRGREAASTMAGHLRRAGIRPSIVLCSSARRARETLEGLAIESDVQIEPAIYGASAAGLLELLQRVPATAESTLLIGHNPAIQSLTLSLAGHGSDLARVRRKFPTGALASLGFAGEWPQLGPGNADLEAFVTPKSLR
jgi:phosphohistidine phosphatase